MLFINEFLLSGIILGFAAGISPGPLLAMVISQSIQHGSREGIKVALSPLISDFLIVSSILLILSHFGNQDFVIAIISLSGAIYLIYLGISSFKSESSDSDIANQKRNSLKKGILVNLLSPHPYLFWITIGGPILFKTLDVDVWATFLFVFGFYTLLVGSKILIAIVAGKSGQFLKSNYYLYTIRALGVVYLVFAFIFIKQGLDFMGWGQIFL
ncbi:MAG: LysE family transporter [Methanolobus sp.]|jgi:threonine/homoserine/homoserine lactone efflux protein|nr:LysE family transporter [Methanolobus sp.]